MINPFELITASKLTATEATDLWCDDNRLARVNGKESCFINGHRGTGKSMLFRILQYDCQKILAPDIEPDFLSVYFSVRDSELMTEELDLFQDDSQRNILSETHFALLIVKQLVLLLAANPTLIPEDKVEEFSSLISAQISSAYQFCTVEPPNLPHEFQQLLQSTIDLVEYERVRVVTYIGLRFYEHARFDGPLFLFDTLLRPLAEFILQEAGKTVYVLIDDADDLPESHTIVLNTWIARRNTAVVFKVSTMFGYKTYQTRSRSAIQHPHDFIQYDIATRYLSDASEDYVNLLRDITRRRLKNIVDDPDPYVFFPQDPDQMRRLQELARVLTAEYEKKYKGRAVRDHVNRHLTSEYIKRVLQPGRSVYTFSYSGFETLAALSSGMVRDFIICAQKMFDNATRNRDSISFISPEIQTDIVRRHADTVLEEITNSKQKRNLSSTRDDWMRVRRLVEGLGNACKQKMLSNASERRVFSFAFQDEPTEEIERLLDLAVSEGYFMKGVISRKEGTGRRTLYVLTRRVAPIYNLDVSSYAGYFSLRSERVLHWMESGADRENSPVQTQFELFDELEILNAAPLEAEESRSIWHFITPEEAGQ